MAAAKDSMVAGMERSRPAPPSAAAAADSCGLVRQPGTPDKLSPPQKRRRRLQDTAAKKEREEIDKYIKDIVSQQLDTAAKTEREEIDKLIENIVSQKLQATLPGYFAQGSWMAAADFLPVPLSSAATFTWNPDAAEFLPQRLEACGQEHIERYETKAMKCEELEMQFRDAERKRYEAEERLSDAAEKAMEMGVKIGQQNTNEMMTVLENLRKEYKELGAKHIAAMEAAKLKEAKLKEMLQNTCEKNRLLQGQVEANVDSKMGGALDKIKMLKGELASLQDKYDALRKHLDPEESDDTSGGEYEGEDEEERMQMMHAFAEEVAGRRVSKARFNWVLDEWERATGEEFNAEAVTASFDSGFFDDSCKERVPDKVKDKG